MATPPPNPYSYPYRYPYRDPYPYAYPYPYRYPTPTPPLTSGVRSQASCGETSVGIDSHGPFHGQWILGRVTG